MNTKSAGMSEIRRVHRERERIVNHSDHEAAPQAQNAASNVGHALPSNQIGSALGTPQRRPDGQNAEVRELVQRARRAQSDWAAIGLRRRSKYLERVQDVLARDSRVIAERIAAETGKPRFEAIMSEVHAVCELAHFLRRRSGDVLRTRRVGVGIVKHKRAWKTYEPYGVFGVISPWNVPLTLSMTPTLSALICGNAVVLKPSEVTPVVAEIIRGVFSEAGLPEHLVGIAEGGDSTGRALVAAGVDKLAFTGSPDTAREIMRSASETLTPLLLELGGKDPMIVCTDADIDRAAAGAVWGAFSNAGQACISIERAYVANSIHDEFVAKVVAITGRLHQGVETAGHSIDVGPMISSRQSDIVQAQVDDAVSAGARVELGGRSRRDLAGTFFEPTVLTRCDNSMKIMRDETFGPVLPIMAVQSDEAAIRYANDSRYGLMASVWSKSAIRAERIARELVVGSTLINDHAIAYGILDLPFGGVKQSGFGRVHGTEGLLEFVRTKAYVSNRFRTRRELFWFPYGSKSFELAARLTGGMYRTRVADKLRAATGRDKKRT